MPSTVQQLIDGHQELVTVSLENTAQQALELMIEHDYSQLPIVEGDGRRVVGDKEKRATMVTNDSILSAIVNFGVSVQDLRVADVMVQTSTFRMEDDLFDLLEDLKDNPAVLVVDGAHLLTGIITNYDTTAYFRRRAEDIMLVEDIENTIKDYILVYFTNNRGEINQAELQTAIEAILPSYNKFNAPFLQALSYYLVLNGSDQQQLDEENAQKAFTEFFKEKAKPFDELSLGQYIDLFTSKLRWGRYIEIFKLERNAIFKLLADVRQSRNGLMHFRDEISRKQRRQLRFCKEWLERHRNEVLESFGISATEPETLPSIVTEVNGTLIKIEDDTFNQNEITNSAEEIMPSVEILSPNDSRYALLALWLQKYPLKQEKVRLSFDFIEELIDDKLPLSARQHRSWWANDSVSHVQSQQWLEVGWRVSNINMAEETVIFTRIKDREKAYIDFFSELMSMLTKVAQFQVREASPDGLNWIVIRRMPYEGPQIGILSFSFARHGRFRVELYIDSGDKEKNEQLFDALYMRKFQIQTELGSLAGHLEWERIDDKRACRIALYHEGAITDSEEKLASLRIWAVDAMIKFQEVMERHISEVL